LVVYIIYISLYFFLRLAKRSQFIPLQNVVYFITLPFSVRKIFIFYINDVLLFKCPVPGPKGLITSLGLMANTVYLNLFSTEKLLN